VGQFWKRQEEPLDLEAELRARRPAPRAELLASVADRVRTERGYRRSGARLAFAGGLTAAMLVALSAVGGMSYAATAVKHAAQKTGWVKISKKHATPAKTSAGAQYLTKVTICHKGKTISVASSAVPAHLRHGDTRGACPKGAGKPANRGGVKGAKKKPKFTG
jgi:hypothetical protein